MLGFLTVWSSGGGTKVAAGSVTEFEAPEAVTADNGEPSDQINSAGAVDHMKENNKTDKPLLEVGEPLGSGSEQSSLLATPGEERPPSSRRLSLQSVASYYRRKGNEDKTHTFSHEKDLKEREKATEAAKYAATSFFFFSRSSKVADKHAEQSALAVHRLIVGTVSISTDSSKVPPVTKAQLTKIKSELMRPKSANRLIAKLREVPVIEEQTQGHHLNKTVDSVAETSVPTTVKKTRGPIHAVCLQETDEEMEKYFSKLMKDDTSVGLLDTITSFPSVATATLTSLVPVFEELHIVNLLGAPDLGLGQPGDGEGILAGAIPTAGTIIEGMTKITPQLMALGYATGKAITPDHTNVYPPLDRISVLTYWWGLEVCLPKPTLQYLDKVDSISHAVINLLTALSVMNEGVREILPFVRYISQFMDFEWNAIKAQDRGKGVVCAATWIMPAAMVPRPWDFPDKPSPPPNPSNDTKPAVAPRTGEGVVEDIRVPPVMLPSLVVTPPSVIKGNGTPATPASQ